VRYLEQTLEGNTNATHACDVANAQIATQRLDLQFTPFWTVRSLVFPAHPYGPGTTVTQTGSNINPGGIVPVVRTPTYDEYHDETDFCSPQCAIRCDGNNNAYSQAYASRSNVNWCLMAAEEHGQHGDTSYCDAQQTTGVFAFNNNENLGATNNCWDDGFNVEPNDEDMERGWRVAREHCESYGIGARLVHIFTQSEQNTLENMMAALDTDTAAHGGTEGDGDGEYWTGLYDDWATPPVVSSNPGRWIWLDGTTPESHSHTAWQANDPNDTGPGGTPADCGEISVNVPNATPNDWLWADQVCTNTDGQRRRFFCEYPY
jgi:hypothetical protein